MNIPANVKYEVKDLTTVVWPYVLIQGVNCQNVMGSGLAKAIYTKWPFVKKQYHEFGKQPLGTIDKLWDSTGPMIINCYTQEFYGRDASVRYASPEAILECFLKVGKHTVEYNTKRVYLPRIGCGLANLHWIDDVMYSLYYVARKYPDVEWIVCDNPEAPKFKVTQHRSSASACASR